MKYLFGSGGGFRRSEVGHFRGEGKSVEFEYKVFGQVNHNIIVTQKIER